MARQMMSAVYNLTIGAPRIGKRTILTGDTIEAYLRSRHIWPVFCDLPIACVVALTISGTTGVRTTSDLIR